MGLSTQLGLVRVPSSAVVEISPSSAPEFAELPNRYPVGAMICSVITHGVAWVGILALGSMLPPSHSVQPVRLLPNRLTYIAPDPEETKLPPLHFAVASSAPSSPAPSARSRNALHAPAPARAAAEPPTFVGPQEIVIKLPAPTNHVQAIVRPDLLNPPKLKFPKPLRSMVMLPLAGTSMPKLQERPKALVVAAPKIVRPVATVAAPKLVVPLGSGKELQTALQTPTVVPQLAAPLKPSPSPEGTGVATKAVGNDAVSKAAIVVNAVVTGNVTDAVPDVQLSASFKVSPGGTAGNTPAGAGEASSSTGSGEAKSTGDGGGASAGAMHGASGGNAASPAGNGAGTSGSGNGLSIAGGTGAGGASGSGVPGISISGGGSAGASHTVRPPGGHSYELTIISGGTSGGASRDVGVFRREESVYTVFIPMDDVTSGGPAWSMQYALLRPMASAFVSPPVAEAKAPALIDAAHYTKDRILIAAIINPDGTLRDVRPVHGADAGAVAAMEALKHWNFKPASVDGAPVAAKVLFGVTLTKEDAAGQKH